MLAYQPKFSTLDLIVDKGSEYVIVGRSKRSFRSTLHPLYTTFLLNTKRFDFKIRIRFYNTALVVKQNNYVTKIVNA